MKRSFLFALLLMMSFSSVFAQQEKTKRKLLKSGADYEFAQIDTYKDNQLTQTYYELAGNNFKYPIETEFKKIFVGDLKAMKTFTDSAYNFMLLSNSDSRNMFMGVQFVAIPRVKQGSAIMIVSSSEMMHVFQKPQLDIIRKEILKVENKK